MKACKRRKGENTGLAIRSQTYASFCHRSDEFQPGEFRRALEKRPAPTREPGLCEDEHVQCKEWADRGECTKNPTFMVGNVDQAGSCMRACQSCEPCTGEEDYACIHRNREKAGFLKLEKEEMEWLGVPWWME